MKSKTKVITINKSGLSKISLTESGQYLFKLTHAGAKLQLIGIFEAQSNQQIRVNLTIHHLAPSTQSAVVLKGVAQDQSVLQLTGLIKIDAHCPQTVSHLTQRILQASGQSRAEILPNLEILTDDVVCTHAASISAIDESQLFYLMSRGLSRSQAKKHIVAGFLHF